QSVARVQGRRRRHPDRRARRAGQGCRLARSQYQPLASRAECEFDREASSPSARIAPPAKEADHVQSACHLRDSFESRLIPSPSVRLRTTPIASTITAGICDWRNGVQNVSLRGSNPEPPMSALCQKQTLRAGYSTTSSARGRIQSTSDNPLNTGTSDLDLRNWGSE